MLSLLGGLAARRPRWLVGGAVAFTLLGIFFGGTVTSRLSSGGTQDPATQSARADTRLAQASAKNAGENVLAVVRLRHDAHSAAGAAEVAGVVRTLKGLGARDVVAPVAGLPARLVSRDGHSALVIVPAGGDRIADRAKAAFAHDPQVVLGGDPVVSQQVNEIVATDMKRAELIALPLLFLLSFLIFRGLVAAMLPPLVGLVTVAGALLGLRIASEMTSLSIYALNLITGLGLGLAIDWSLFIVSRYREELAVHGPGAKALRETLRTAGRTVLFSSLTVAAALASLLVFPQSFLRSMGLGGMLVALIGAGVSLVFLPAVLALLGHRVDSLAPKRFQRASAKAARPASSGYWFRLSHVVMKRPVVIAAATATLLVVLGLPFTGVRFTGFDPSVLPKASSGRQVDKIVHTEFATDLNPTAYAVVSAPAKARPAVAALAARLGALPGEPAVAAPVLVGRDTWLIDVGTNATAELERRAASRGSDARGAVGLPDARRRRLCVARRSEVEPRLEPAVRARDPRRRDALRALPDDRVDRAADQGDRAQPAHDRLGLRRARLDLPGRPDAGAARLLGTGRDRHDAADPDRRDRVRALDRLRRLPADADQGGARRRRRQQGGRRVRARAHRADRDRCGAASSSSRSAPSPRPGSSRSRRSGSAPGSRC